MLRSTSLRVLATILIAIGLRAGAAEAAVITYNNLASWQSAVVGVNTTTFEENGPGGFTFYGAGPVTFGGATFTLPGAVSPDGIFTVDPDVDPLGYGGIGTGDVLSGQGSSPLTITGGGVTALAFDWMTWVNTTLSVTLSTGDVIPLAATGFVPGFFGVTSTVPITGLTVTVPAPTIDFPTGVLVIDNFGTASAAAPVPEPGSLLLFISGVVALSVRRRMRHTTAPG